MRDDGLMLDSRSVFLGVLQVGGIVVMSNDGVVYAVR